MEGGGGGGGVELRCNRSRTDNDRTSQQSNSDNNTIQGLTNRYFRPGKDSIISSFEQDFNMTQEYLKTVRTHC